LYTKRLRPDAADGSSPAPRDAQRDAWSPTPLVRASLWVHGGTAAVLAASPTLWAEAAALLAANHAVLACGMHPQSAMLGPNLVRLPRTSAARGEVALTFDDGPDPEATPRVLDLLDEAGARATFFLIGRQALRHPHLAREIVRRGHAVGNHTHRHPFSFACWTPAAMAREIEEAQRAIADACGRAPALFRPPVGLRSPLLDPVLARSRLSLVSWSRRGCDGIVGRAEIVLRRLTRGLAAGEILLLHDGRSARAAAPGCGPVVLDVLPPLLERLSSLGLRSVPLAADALRVRPHPAAPAGATAGSAAGAASRTPAARASM
jgi:peptidoglycan-N-acetylglucosamine deacetylase